MYLVFVFQFCILQYSDLKKKQLSYSVSTVASSEPIVSTDGLGSSCDGSISSFEEQPYRPAFARNLGLLVLFIYTVNLACIVNRDKQYKKKMKET